MKYDGIERQSTFTLFIYIIYIALYMIRKNKDHESKPIKNFRQHINRLNEKTQLLRN
jgi:hypothetical protein